MPFTPFHTGPGIFIKALLQGSFSLMVFAWAQIIMDLQPLFVLITGKGQLHGISHTFSGASLLAVVAALSGKYLSEAGLRISGIAEKESPIQIAWPVAFLSAYIGTFSHVVLDGIMHSDVQPYYPVFEANHLLGIMSVGGLHKFCIYSGLVGAGLYFLLRFTLKKTVRGTQAGPR